VQRTPGARQPKIAVARDRPRSRIFGDNHTSSRHAPWSSCPGFRVAKTLE